MRYRVSLTILAVVAWLTVLAPAALAEHHHDNGEGLFGETDDKIVTFFSLGVVAFFAVVVIVGSIIQGRLERRKEEKKASRVRQRLGW